MYSQTQRTKQKKSTWILLPITIFLGLVIVGLTKGWRPSFIAKPTVTSSSYELAAWEWRPPSKFSAEELASYMEFANNENISTIYINIGDVVDINEIADEVEKSRRLLEFSATLRQYIQAAHRNGIEVHGLAGSVQWADPDFRYLPLQVMDYVGTYNTGSTLEERLDGIQFDIENYNEKSFDNDKAGNLGNYLETVNRINAKLIEMHAADSRLKLGFAVPYWFDNENNNIPAIYFNAVEKPVGYHMMDILNQTDKGYLAIMDYRNKAEGKNGSIEQAQNEITYAETQAKKVQIVIGQLTNEAKPESTTFFGQEPAKLYTEMSLLNDRFKGSPNYGGLAVHDFRSFEKLLDD